MSGPFRRGTLRALIAMGAVSFAAFLALSVFEEEVTTVRSSGNDVFSVSALGHRAWADVLAEVGIPIYARRRLRAQTPEGALVVIAEPDVHDEAARHHLSDVLARAPRALLVLPKWQVIDTDGPNVLWVAPVDGIVHERVLAAVGSGAIVRLADRGAELGDLTGPDAGGASSVRMPQMLEGGAVPEVFAKSGTLVGRIESETSTVWVLSDPDLVANHGLRRGDNALLAVRLVERLRNGGPVIFDETVHGHGVETSIYRDLFSFPLGIVLLHVALALAAALWAGVQRFGSPTPVRVRQAPGRTTLVDATADLLLHGGMARMLLGRYLERAVEDVAATSGAGARSTLSERHERAADVARRRGATESLDTLRSDVRICVRDERTNAGHADRRALAVARRIHSWRRESLDADR